MASWSAVVVTRGVIIKAITEGEVRGTTQNLRTKRVMRHSHDQVIICGYRRTRQTLSREFYEAGVPFVVIDCDKERVAQIREDGFTEYRGDATEVSTLQFVGILRAKTLTTVLQHDALNVFITLTARNLSRKITINARGEQASTEKKLRHAGEDDVILSATIGGWGDKRPESARRRRIYRHFAHPPSPRFYRVRC